MFAPFGGAGWAFVSLFYLSIFIYLADASVTGAIDGPKTPQPATAWTTEGIPVALALCHFVLLPLAVLSVTNPAASIGAKLINFLAFALFFALVSTSIGHELIHRPGRILNTLGRWVFISLLFGHHYSAHLGVHHKYAATPCDPNSARLNEGFYRFFARAWRGSFKAGLALENQRRRQKSGPSSRLSHPYVIYAAGAGYFLVVATVIAGWSGFLAYLGFAVFAQAALLLSDYVQHYGLVRHTLESGEYAPVSVHHSWNSPRIFSSALMLNAPRHSDHHANPARKYSELRDRASAGAPTLPYSIPVMSALALLPPIWKSRLRNRVLLARAQDQSPTSSSVSIDPKVC